MLGDTIRILRHKLGWTQERLAEEIHTSRQTIAKWESGVSAPDIQTSILLADAFQVTLDDLLRAQSPESAARIRPKGKYVWMMTIREDHSVVLPQEAMQVFHLAVGNQLLMLGDAEQGIALVRAEDFRIFADAVREARKKAEQEEPSWNQESKSGD